MKTIIALWLNEADGQAVQYEDWDSILPYRQLRVTITSAQLLNIFTTPVTLIPAPWTDKYIVVDGIIATLDFNTTAYAGTDDLQYHYTGTVNLSSKFTLNSLVNSSVNAVSEASNSSPDCFINEPVVALMPNADPTLWDSDIILDITYRIITL